MIISSEHRAALREFAMTFPHGSLVKAIPDANRSTRVLLDGQTFIEPTFESAQIEFRGADVVASCGCDAGGRCKHLALLTVKLIGLVSTVFVDRLTGVPIIPESAAEARAKLAAPPPASAKDPEAEPSAAPPVIVPTPVARGIIAMLRERLKRELKPVELTVAKRIEEMFRRMHHMDTILESAVSSITGYKPQYPFRAHRVWYQRPGDSWEFWLLLAGLCTQNGWSIPPFLTAATSPAEIEEVRMRQKRLHDVAHWKSVFARGSADEVPVVLDPLTFRARFGEKSLQLEASRAGGPFETVKATHFRRINDAANQGVLQCDAMSLIVWNLFATLEAPGPDIDYAIRHSEVRTVLKAGAEGGKFVGSGGAVLTWQPTPLQWKLSPPKEGDSDYWLRLETPDGSRIPKVLVTYDGDPAYVVTDTHIFLSPPLLNLDPGSEHRVPREAVESKDGVAVFDRIRVDLPEPLKKRVKTLSAVVTFDCVLKKNKFTSAGEEMEVIITSRIAELKQEECYTKQGWVMFGRPENYTAKAGEITRMDRSVLQVVPDLVEALKMTPPRVDYTWSKSVTKKFAEQFAEWLTLVPPQVRLKLSPELESLKSGVVAATLKLDVEEDGIDWFDLRVSLDVEDTTLTKEEIKLLLDARGGFVRLGEKGWRRLKFNLSEEEESQLADIGISARDLMGTRQRVHALQLAGRAASKLLPQDRVVKLERRADDIRTRVQPDVPTEIKATLRPYQIEGFQFLAYLSTNKFGGILADDMGLGKTLQTLSWLAWLRAQPDFSGRTSLVVCPKSVAANWCAEAEKFYPTLRLKAWDRQEVRQFKSFVEDADVLVINYTQLRVLEDQVLGRPWHCAILDEAQYIKNPSSQTAQAACKIRADHRLALSGTPIENRLMDLWSIMAFAMPGMLGVRSNFTKHFDGRSDPFARRRLSARVRPFVMRRTKKEVASDLPDRIEEDIHCEMEDAQATLYRAELKRARAQLLNIATSAELDKARFSILTSLLRLRQICCHPELVAPGKGHESAKFIALFDLLEPLIEEGHKVLVFSQFVEMLSIIKRELESREAPHLILTGQTEDRGDLVREFQQKEGACVFLISLKAGGFGLNLTAASYVVLFDPWWNPAVENQAIDRTHRIGQTNKVVAYRLVVKESIEEKIRTLQKHKAALAADVLGEENFARALSLDDFRFLLEN